MLDTYILAWLCHPLLSNLTLIPTPHLGLSFTLCKMGWLDTLISRPHPALHICIQIGEVLQKHPTIRWFYCTIKMMLLSKQHPVMFPHVCHFPSVQQGIAGDQL